MLTLRQIVLLAPIPILGLGAATMRAGNNPREALWAAVRNGDANVAKALLDQGTDVNARNEIGITALWIAASKGKPEVVELLLERGADVNARDGIWYQTPLSLALRGGNADLVKRLLQAGARDVDEAALAAAARGNAALLQVLLDTGKVGQGALDAALFSTAESRKEVREALTTAGAKPLPPADPKDRAAWAPLAGTYTSDNGGTLTVRIADAGLVTGPASGPGTAYRPTGPNTFAPVGVAGSSLTFERKGDKVARVVSKRFTAETYFFPAKPVAKPTAPPQEGDAMVAAPRNWPQFRGPDATGIADGQHPPITWDVKTGTNVRWKTPIPGLGHSCPVIWGDRVFLTTALSGDPDPKVRTGNYGDVESVNDTTRHIWQVLCLDRDTGKILWVRTAFEGVPKIKRHLKGSQANCTPATDGKRLVACFGPEGLYCYDLDGQLLWKRDLSTIDSSFAIEREYEWGFGSSPVIHDGLVLLQFDLSRDSFLAAYSLEDGSQVWSTPRDEIPSWSTPTVWRNAQRTEIVTNAAQYARGYDPATGKELWRLAKKSEITVPTPVPAGDLVFVVSGNRPIQPIFVIKPGASGDISLPDGQSSSAHIAWSKLRGGPYMPTPIVYGPHLYVCSNAGVVTCYEAVTGQEVYRERIGGESYTASPVAADGRLYFVSEQGEVRVVKAGAEFELLAVNAMGDVCMAVPAISGGMLFVRSQHFLFALGRIPPDK
jgi:outer membrane protein assembly factor BamB